MIKLKKPVDSCGWWYGLCQHVMTNTLTQVMMYWFMSRCHIHIQNVIF